MFVYSFKMMYSSTCFSRVFCSWLVYMLMFVVTHSAGWPFTSRDVDGDIIWNGKWFPQPPDKEDDNVEVDFRNTAPELYDTKQGVQMGVSSEQCDNAKINLTIDWNNSPINYTCFENRNEYAPKYDVHPILHNDHIPQHYHAQHKCMDTEICYEDAIPSFGPHRPLWPKWGEYLFIPVQRWLHSLEHGGIVMLYHPCANPNEVQMLRQLVMGCLYRHIITPYHLSTDRPLALVAWGHRLEISKVHKPLVLDFILKYAFQGAYDFAKDGQFDFGIMSHAKIVSDENDHKLCPNI